MRPADIRKTIAQDGLPPGASPLPDLVGHDVLIADVYQRSPNEPAAKTLIDRLMWSHRYRETCRADEIMADGIHGDVVTDRLHVRRCTVAELCELSEQAGDDIVIKAQLDAPGDECQAYSSTVHVVIQGGAVLAVRRLESWAPGVDAICDASDMIQLAGLFVDGTIVPGSRREWREHA